MEKPMYREVKTIEDLQKFDCEWKKICDEKGAKFYPYHPNSTRYFLLDHAGNDVGTIEFTKRNPRVFSVCEDFFDFTNHPKVSSNENEIMEVGKICIINEYRREGHVDKLLYLMLEYAEKHDIKQYLGYMNKEFLRVIFFCYGLKMTRLGKEIVHEKNVSVPVMCDVEQQMQRLLDKGFIRPTTFLQ